MRFPRERSPLSPTTSKARLAIENLEDRLTPSWGAVPPSMIAIPTTAVTATLNSNGDASGNAAITANEVDYYKFTSKGGAFTLSATTPSSNMDTVIAVYNAAGQRVAYNDDVSSTNRDSRLTTNLAAGTYYFGVTNYTRTAGGSYTFTVDGPAVSPPPAPPTVPPPSPPTTGGFQITLRTTGLTATQQAIFQQAANRWAQVITGDLPNATYNGVAVDDVLIDASGAAIDGVGGILGQAGPDSVRSGTLLPIHGTMQFDTADLAQLEANGGLYYTVLHEMGHVLGIGTIWQQRGLVSGAGTSNPVFTGANAVAAYNAVFGMSVTGVPVENTGGAGTRDSHWRESVFGNEVMTGYLNNGVNPLSRVTVASLADLGYQVNMAAADAYTPPGRTAQLALSVGTTSGAPALLAPVGTGGANALSPERTAEFFERLAAHVASVLNDVGQLQFQFQATDTSHQSRDPLSRSVFDLLM